MLSRRRAARILFLRGSRLGPAFRLGHAGHLLDSFSYSLRRPTCVRFVRDPCGSRAVLGTSPARCADRRCWPSSNGSRSTTDWLPKTGCPCPAINRLPQATPAGAPRPGPEPPGIVQVP